MKIAIAIGDIGDCIACGVEFVAKGTRQVSCGTRQCRSLIQRWQQKNCRNRKKGLPELTFDEFKKTAKPPRQPQIDEDFPNHCAMCGAHIIDGKTVCRFCYNPRLHKDTCVDEINPICNKECLNVDNANEIEVVI